MPLLDTRKGRDLTGELIADIVLQLLSYVAQTERDFIRSRQAEGIAIAKAKGVHFGKKPHPIPPGFETVYHQCQNGTLSARKAGKALGVSHQTFLKWARTQNPVVTKVDFRNHKNTKNNLANSGLFCYYIGIRWCVFVSLTPWLQKSTILTTQSTNASPNLAKL